MCNIFRRLMCYKKICGCTKCGKCQCNRDISNINEITYDKLLEKVKEGAILIDVRTKQEFNEGHLDGAILIPYYEISKKVSDIIPNKNQSIIVYCQNGGRSQKAYKTLNNIGYNNIYNLKGGREGIL